MLAPMLFLALLCVGIGLLPEIALKLLSGAAAILNPGINAPLPPLPFGPLWSLGGTALIIIATTLLILSPSRRQKKTVTTWGCGFLHTTPRMSYMAGGFSELAADSLLCKGMQPATTATPAKTIFPMPSEFSLNSIDPILQRGLAPLFSQLAQRAYLFRKLQAGKLNVYLLYMFLATTILLGWVMWLG